MTSPRLLRTVPSYFRVTSSMAFTRRLWMYPVLEVFTAVSMSPSRPPMAWKKNSCGVSPRRYEFSTNPRDSGPWSSFRKWGSVRFTKPKGMRFPSTFCCPTQAVIWEMLMKEPLDPPVTMILMWLCSARLPCALFPAASRAWFSVLFTLASKVSTMVLPGCASRSPRWASWISFSTSSLASPMILLIVPIVASSATVSPMPTVKPCCMSQ
mmetsp:Transcript_3996/g.11133  ORF Transcript_3996/g.11133 Transcript_3996/m.11133 type:complete len:210 (-) Transcript_3996:1531-2160(-)